MNWIPTFTRTPFFRLWRHLGPLLCLAACLSQAPQGTAASPKAVLRRTSVSIVGDSFYLNGTPTYAGRVWNGFSVQGLLLNSRMVQGIFDDQNPQTTGRWAYPDTGRWDPERNTREFIAAMPEWRKNGLLAITLNLQGGSPEGYSKEQPWQNSAFAFDGSLLDPYMKRLERILNRADELGMVVILGYFYFGQDQRLKDEGAVIRATDNASKWLLDRGYRHVLVEINNECNIYYDHPILKPDQVHQLIQSVQAMRQEGRRLLVGTSFGGGTVPTENVVRVSDFVLLHGNGVSDPNRIARMVQETRKLQGDWQRPILFNEDDHFEFDRPVNNFVAALSQHASWGFFDPGKGNYQDGFQSMPVNWKINTERKEAFFGLLREISGGAASPSRLGALLSRVAAPGQGPVKITYTNYHGWPNSIVLHNGKAEVIIVPTIGRIMQFQLVGEAGPFFENRALDGRSPNPTSAEWGNFGGDKTWPAPQSAWPKITPRAWPPPQAFDSMPVQASMNEKKGGVTLLSPIDPHFGIRTVRHITLDPDKPVLTVTTTYEKEEGDPRKVAVWTITQLNDPVAVYAPLPLPSRFSDGYLPQSEKLPTALKVDNGLLSLKRSTTSAHKIGTDSGTLLWVGEKVMVRIDSPRESNREYPDEGSSAEIYTNGDPLPYVELEMLGPLYPMKTGSRITATNVYTLMRRTHADPDAEARQVLGR